MPQPLKLPVAFGRMLGKELPKDAAGATPAPEPEGPVKPGRTPRCRTLKESVKQHVKLLLLTRFGEYRYDPRYGTHLWEQDFDTTIHFNDWRVEAETSIRQTVQGREYRLSEVKVTITVTDHEFFNKERKSVRLKKKLSIRVEGLLAQTNERFEVVETVYFNPVSLD